MTNQPHPVLQGSPVEEATLYELKVFVHELLKRVDRLEKAVKRLEDAPDLTPACPACEDLHADVVPTQDHTCKPEKIPVVTFAQECREREDYLESIRSPKGGWGAAELAKIGVNWPPPHGWRKHYIKTGKALA